ncbi:MAG: hypothetical protein Q4E62_04445 [Sutterellaceae bacterium]|nr:hypothetical protein [Sutterellaceae bacterium]
MRFGFKLSLVGLAVTGLFATGASTFSMAAQVDDESAEVFIGQVAEDEQQSRMRQRNRQRMESDADSQSPRSRRYRNNDDADESENFNQRRRQREGQGQYQSQRPGTRQMQAAPDGNVESERVFRRPKIVIHNRVKEEKEEETRKAEAEKFLYPSLNFLAQFDPWKLQIGDVTLLQDNYASLKRKHQDCRRISASRWETGIGRVACSDTQNFRAEGEEVIFTMAEVNEVLTGVTFRFNSQMRAGQFAEGIKERLRQLSIPTFVESHSADSETVDSPMFSISVQPAQTGYLVKVDAHFQDRLLDSEIYARAKLQKIEFGNMTLGETKRNAMPKVPKVCENLSKNPDGDPLEFYGTCFEFPYEAHMQLNFNPATDILQTAVLSPIGAATGALVDEMLMKRFGLPQFCRKLETDVELVTIKSKKERGALRFRRMNGRSASVYAGTCEKPIIYTSDMRYVFENRYLNRDDIMADYERRKSLVEASEDHLSAFGERLDKVKGFFD